MLKIHVRTVLVTLSPLLADIVKQLVGDQIGLDIVARFDRRALLSTKLPQIAPDLVLVGLRSHEADGVGRSVLEFLPTAKVISLSSDARQAYLHEMRPHRAIIVDVSARALIEAIRGPGSRRFKSELMRLDPLCDPKMDSI
jgi:DNA-binding NarL/FixJ family response regulator